MSTTIAAKQKTATKKSTNEYVEAVGRRKTAIARVRASEAAKTTCVVNDKPIDAYFATPALRAIANAPIEREGFPVKYAITVRVSGGGIHAQAEAVRHALSRILIKEDPAEKKELKKLGFLKRDARKKERKHFGLKKARKASQWSKR